MNRFGDLIWEDQDHSTRRAVKKQKPSPVGAFRAREKRFTYRGVGRKLYVDYRKRERKEEKTRHACTSGNCTGSIKRRISTHPLCSSGL